MPEVAVATIEQHDLAKCCWCGRPFVRGLVTILGLAPWTCPTEACWRRQVADAMIVTVKGRPRTDLGGNRRCRFVPLPRQVEAMDALKGAATYIMIGGAAGGSKSRGLREIAHRQCMTQPHYRVLLLRRTFRELESNHILDAQVEAPEMGAECVPSAKVIRYANGSQLQFGHCETAADAANYLSSEYDLIIFDELVTFEEVQFLLIASRARSTKAGVTPKVLAGTNPGGPQSHWVRSRFIDHTVDLEQFPDYVPEDWRFIPSKLEDNPYLDRAYERKLLALPPELRKAYRDGDWDIFPGMFFPEWRKSTHVTATHLAYPKEWPRVLAMDWGYVAPGYVGWWVEHPEGHLYLEQEYVFTRTTAMDVGKEIARRTHAAGLKRCKYLVYDTAMEIPNTDTGESTIETVRRGMRAEKLGLATRPADKERVNGWSRLRHWFRLAPDGKPWMQSSPECPYFNRTIPSLISDDTHPEDVDTHGLDHAGDSARYLAQSLPMPGQTSKTEPVKPWSMAWLKSHGGKPHGPLASRSAA